MHQLFESPYRRAWRNHYSTSPPPVGNSRFASYRQALNTLAERTRTPLPSLVFSFALLHELTAIVPLVGFFYTARALNIGDRVIDWLPTKADDDDVEVVSPPQEWVAAKSQEWLKEGAAWAERVGRRYGIFGFEKRDRKDPSAAVQSLDGAEDGRGPWVPNRLAGDAVNAVVAYCLTKALLPVRIGASLYFSPAFSRRVVEPMRTAATRAFRRSPRDISEPLKRD